MSRQNKVGSAVRRNPLQTQKQQFQLLCKRRGSGAGAGEGLPAAAPCSGKVGGVAEQPVATLGSNRAGREECWEKNLSLSLSLSLARPRSRARTAAPILAPPIDPPSSPFAPAPTHLQDGAVVEVVCAGPALQRGEGHVAAGERRDVAEVVGAERLLLVLAGADEAAVQLLVRLLARATVVLVRHPRPPLAAALVDDKALRAAGVELQPHVGDVERLACGRKVGGGGEGIRGVKG